MKMAGMRMGVYDNDLLLLLEQHKMTLRQDSKHNDSNPTGLNTH